ncbi:MAG: carboxylating nicotinate-nucleotide diphosphorylase [Nitrospirota bacterium]
MALREDIGHGDITTSAILSEPLPAEGIIRAKEEMVIAGVGIAEEVFKILNESCQRHSSSIDIDIASCARDGERLKDGDIIIKISGDGRLLLMGERVALNFLQRMSGVATMTAQYVDEIRGFKTMIVDTRKTTPNMRILEKEAVRTGGGRNHRFGLMDGVLIKDNHIAMANGIENAVKRVREKAPHTLKIEVEVSTLKDIEQALECRADIIMFDNMDIETIKKGIEIVQGKAIIEVSGRVDIKNVREIAALGVDIISIGALTHSAGSVDISMGITCIC